MPTEPAEQSGQDIEVGAFESTEWQCLPFIGYQTFIFVYKHQSMDLTIMAHIIIVQYSHDNYMKWMNDVWDILLF